jgi:4-oxalocrotonate tautomerase
MPHVIMKLWPGKSEDQKNRLAEAITKNIMDILHYGGDGRNQTPGLGGESV